VCSQSSKNNAKPPCWDGPAFRTENGSTIQFDLMDELMQRRISQCCKQHLEASCLPEVTSLSFGFRILSRSARESVPELVHSLPFVSSHSALSQPAINSAVLTCSPPFISRSASRIPLPDCLLTCTSAQHSNIPALFFGLALFLRLALCDIVSTPIHCSLDCIFLIVDFKPGSCLLDLWIF